METTVKQTNMNTKIKCLSLNVTFDVNDRLFHFSFSIYIFINNIIYLFNKKIFFIFVYKAKSFSLILR